MGERASKHLNQMSDFWWLPKNVAVGKLLVGVGHHKVVVDNEEVPPLDEWYRSFDHKRNLSNNIEYYPVHLLNDWRRVCKNTNVYRTLKIFDKNTKKASLLGPFLIDIDNSDEDLDDTQTITIQVADYLLDKQGISKDDLRIFFSGHKGFNIEIYPQALKMRGMISDQIKCFSMNLDGTIDVLRRNNKVLNDTRNMVSNRGTCIDRIYGDRFGYKLKHPYIRLHNSVNKWIRGSESEITRMKIELTVKQLRNMSVAEISSKSEELAQIP